MTTMNDLDQQSATNLVPFVTFTWGVSYENVARYVRYDEDVVDADDNVFTSAPELELVDTWTQQGGAADMPLNLVLLATRTPVSQMSALYTVPNIKVQVDEADPHEIETYRNVTHGFVTKTTLNSTGYRKLTKVQVSGYRQYLSYPLGIIADTSCAWTFADKTAYPLSIPGANNCQIDPVPLVQAGTITGVTGNVAAVTGLSDGGVANYWQFGSITVDGASVLISQSPIGSALITTIQPVPPSWVGVSANFLPGCDKKYGTGCLRWNNQVRFGGFGILIPAYQPQYESVK